MADFNKVMKDAFRLCATVSNCDNCPIFEKCIQKAGFTEEKFSSFGNRCLIITETGGGNTNVPIVGK